MPNLHIDVICGKGELMISSYDNYYFNATRKNKHMTVSKHRYLVKQHIICDILL